MIRGGAAGLLLLLLLTACANVPSGPQPLAGVDYQVDARANTAERRFDLVLVSMAATDLCLLPNDWPNAVGRIDHQGEPSIVATVEGVDHPLAIDNMGYCPNCVVATVKPGRRVMAFLPYDHFEGLNPRATDAPTLRFSPHPLWCDDA